MKPVRGIQWPESLLDHVKGVGVDAFGSLDERGNVEADKMDLLCCKPSQLVGTYRKLTELIARVAVANPHYQLFFRGQTKLHTIGPLEVHSLCPSLWRGLDAKNEGFHDSLIARCRKLFMAGEVLVEEYTRYGHGESETEELLRNNPLARWAILQHYELCTRLCGTPMLDITQSLRVATSFALQGGSNAEGYLYILGMPYQREMFSVDSRSGITSVSLLGAMPSTALRPYVQNGYLAVDNDWWRLYALDNESVNNTYHVNFAERIIACVRIGGDGFWDDASNGIISESALYPTDDLFQEFVADTLLKNRIEDALHKID